MIAIDHSSVSTLSQFISFERMPRYIPRVSVGSRRSSTLILGAERASGIARELRQESKTAARGGGAAPAGAPARISSRASEAGRFAAASLLV